MLTLKEMMAAAQAMVEKIDVARAQEMAAEGALLLDIRDAPELEKAGQAVGAHHVPRGMLEFRADPDSPFHDPQFRRDRPILVFCASGGRAFLAGRTLKQMGYEQVYNIGGFKDWQEAGAPVEEPFDPGM